MVRAWRKHPTTACQCVVEGTSAPTRLRSLARRRAAEGDLVSHLATQVTKFKLPARWVFVDVLPRNLNNKIDRKHLRQELKDVMFAAATR
jgi:acyl-coenzyme A synthetase/AMP-(fatty) acid ligase